MTVRAGAVLLALALGGCAGSGREEGSAVESTLFVNARLADGTGGELVAGSLRIEAGTIRELGDLTPIPGEEMIDAAGLVLAPGFIDTHSHHDRGLLEQREASAAVSQGITTIIVGADGGSNSPLSEFFAKVETAPPAVNVASFSGHNSLRAQVLGEDYRREASAAEIDRMKDLLEADLAQGALGLSTGLEYDPGIYSTTEEVLALAKVASAAGGRYLSHLRSEDRNLMEAVDELIRIGREAEMPVQISHFKLAMKSLWGRAPEILERLDQARAEGIEVTADIYPYAFWQSTMTVVFPDRNYTLENAEFALEELVPPEGFLVSRFPPQPEYVGRTLASIAAERGKPAPEVFLELIEESRAGYEEPNSPNEMIIATSMAEEDIEAIIRWPHTNFCSDGMLNDRHPRGAGSFSRFFAEYVRERGVLTVGEAVRRASGLTARHMGLEDRGLLRIGGAADLVLFDPEAIRDRATPEEPSLLSVGIAGVWVNGEKVWDGERATGAFPGQVVRRQGVHSN